MKLQALAFSIFILLSGFALQSCVKTVSADNKDKQETSYAWTSIEAAADLSKTNDKKILVDIYTDWCKWCKVMEDKTFADPKVKAYLSKNYNLAKLNAEHKTSIQFKGKAYNYIQGQRRGYNELANEILEGQMAYPSLAVFDSKLNKLEVYRGFKSAEDLLELLKKAEL